MRYFTGFLGIAALAVFIFFLSRMVVDNYEISGESMRPGICAGERLLINKMAYQFSEPCRGEIVYYRSPDGGSDRLKRVIGLPGDIIEIKDRAVYVNGITLTEPYAKTSPEYSLSSYQVPLNHYYLLEDNRTIIDDSSPGCTVSRDNIMGRAWIYSWPPEKWGTVDSYPLEPQMIATGLH